jgi:hypothetical protein
VSRGFLASAGLASAVGDGSEEGEENALPSARRTLCIGNERGSVERKTLPALVDRDRFEGAPERGVIREPATPGEAIPKLGEELRFGRDGDVRMAKEDRL